MPSSSEFREYENGVADVWASVVGDAATVRRNIRLPSRSGGKPRQIDVCVQGDIFGLTNARLVVDCKRWKKAIDIADVEAFIGLVDDVGADMGLLVSAAGASDGAIGRAQAVRGVRIKALSTNELRSGRPVGTVSRTIEIRRVNLNDATQALREAGLRVHTIEASEDRIRIEVFRHHGTKQPSGEIQHAQHDLTDATLDKINISYVTISQGVTAGGGTPNHRWIPVRLTSLGPPIRILAATEAELAENIAMMAGQLGVPAESLIVERPDGWPFANAFPI